MWPSAVLRGDPGGIVIGARTSIQDGTVIHTTPVTPTRVGSDCVIGHLVHLEGCVIGNGSLVGSGAIVLNGAVVEDEALVAARRARCRGSMVVPSRAMAMGVPAKLKLDAVDPSSTSRWAWPSTASADAPTAHTCAASTEPPAYISLVGVAPVHWVSEAAGDAEAAHRRP